MTKWSPARRRFVAALALYLAWVGILAAMAITSSKRPPTKLVPAAAEESPADDAANP